MKKPMLDEPIETQENVEDEEFDDVDLTFSLSINAEDSRGITLDDAINDKMHPQNIKWPNDIYREFMEIVMKYQLLCRNLISLICSNSVFTTFLLYSYHHSMQ